EGPSSVHPGVGPCVGPSGAAPGGPSSVTSAPGARWAWDFCTPQLRRGVYERNSAPECRFPTGQTTGRPSARAWPRLAALRPPPSILGLCPAPSVVGPRRPSSGAEPSGPRRPPSGAEPSGTLRLPGSSPRDPPPSGPEPADIAPSRWAEAAPCESIGP